MPPWLSAKTAGLPRWAWALMLTGAVGVGLYLRSRPSAESEDESVDPFTGADGGGTTGPLALAGPSQGQLTPVESPYIPEGIVNTVEQLSILASELGATLGQRQEREIEQAPQEKAPTPVTGGGPPVSPVPHTPPPPAPAPSCPSGMTHTIRKNRTEMTRLKAEIGAQQAQITNLTNLLQNHPNAAQRGNWIATRNQLRGSIVHKRNKVAGMHAVNVSYRKFPGCGSV